MVINPRRIALLIAATGLYCFAGFLAMCLATDVEGNLPSQWVWLVWVWIFSLPAGVASGFWLWVLGRRDWRCLELYIVSLLSVVAVISSAVTAAFVTILGWELLEPFSSFFRFDSPFADIEMRDLPLSLLIGAGMALGMTLAWQLVRLAFYIKRKYA